MEEQGGGPGPARVGPGSPKLFERLFVLKQQVTSIVDTCLKHWALRVWVPISKPFHSSIYGSWHFIIGYYEVEYYKWFFFAYFTFRIYGDIPDCWHQRKLHLGVWYWKLGKWLQIYRLMWITGMKILVKNDEIWNDRGAVIGVWKLLLRNTILQNLKLFCYRITLMLHVLMVSISDYFNRKPLHPVQFHKLRPNRTVMRVRWSAHVT